jgi:HPt (histidine-containing phosphotransfer) domain-containing protein
MEPELDLSILADACGGNMTVIGMALRLFVQTTRADLAKLDAVVASENVDGTLASAHRIKGAARQIGASAVMAASQAIEAAAELPDWPVIRAALPRLKAGFEALEAHIAQHYPG